MPPQSNQDKDSDVAFQRSLLQYSSNETNIKSWLSKSLHVKNGTTSAENAQHEEADIEGDEEEGGLGYVPPANTLSQDRQSYSANDRLREQLLGKQRNQATAQHRKFQNRKADALSASKPRPQVKSAKLPESDDEAEGRTSSTSKKLGKIAPTATPGRKAEVPTNDRSHGTSSSKKRPVSYLDEILAQRTQKKTKS